MRLFLSLLLLFSTSKLLLAKEKILIFSCSSGGGHAATANALYGILENEYDPIISCPQDDLFPTANKIYNYHLANGHLFLLNTGYYFRNLVLPLFFLFQGDKMINHLRASIEKEKPKLLISVVPYGNHFILDLANEYKIPFLIVTSDNDIRHWVYGLKNKDLSRLQITIGRDLPCSKGFLVENGFTPSQIKVAGLAVRPDFYESKDKESICKQHNLPIDKPKIILIFGGSGSKRILEYVKKIDSHERGVHLIACAGKNENLAKQLKMIELNEGNSLTALPFTHRISDFMAISDLIITKPGPGTIEEALVLERPMLIDQTQISCVWEKANSAIVQSYGVGDIIPNLKALEKCVHRHLRNDQQKKEMIESFKKIPKNHFPETIREIVQKIAY